jgi:hypothetical protein
MRAATTITRERDPPPLLQGNESLHHYHKGMRATTTITREREPPPLSQGNESHHHYHKGMRATRLFNAFQTVPRSERPNMFQTCSTRYLRKLLGSQPIKNRCGNYNLISAGGGEMGKKHRRISSEHKLNGENEFAELVGQEYLRGATNQILEQRYTTRMPREQTSINLARRAL